MRRIMRAKGSWSLCRAVGLVLCAALVLGAVAARPAHAMQLATGSYTGNGVAGHTIRGVGFRPDTVIIKAHAPQLAVMRTATMVGDAAKQLASATALQSARITSLDDDGFSVGSHGEVNGTGVTYSWVAFRDDGAGDFGVGSYGGNGIDNRNIGGLGFQPSYVIVMAEGAQRAVQRSSAMAGDYSLPFDSTGPTANYLQALLSDGFQVGSDARVNKSGTTYHYVAWKAAAGTMRVGSYIGNDKDNRPITGIGFRPDYLIVKASVNETAVHRSALLSGDTTLTFSASASLHHAIQALESDGFQVGTANTVNGVKTTYFWVAFRSSAGAPVPSLAVTSVNGGSEPVAGPAFAVVVQSRDAGGIRRNVTSPTGVSLSLKTGSGPLGGTLTGTIPAGASEVTISGVSYTKAESGVVLTASRTSGDALMPGDSLPFAVKPGAIAGYVISFSSPQAAGATFGITVSAQDQFANAVTNDSSTLVAFNDSSGHVMFDADADGTFGDNMKALNVGAASVNARSTMAGTTTMRATDANGNMGSASLTVTPGAASTLTFTTQPGNASVNSAIPGPPTVAVQDAFGNPITSSKASITIALGANPGGSALAGTTSKSTREGIARFDDLTIGQPGSSYTLTASSPGLTVASSAAFTVMALTGALSGTVTAGSDGHRLAGVGIEAFQAGLVKASVTTGADGIYAMGGLNPGSYDIRASATGYGSLTSTSIVVTGGSTTTVNFTLNAVPGLAIKISAPTTATFLHEPATVVQGEVSGEGAIGVTLTASTTIQGHPIDLPVPVQVNGGRFAGLVGLTPGSVQLIARASDSTGRSAQDSITITFQPDPPDFDQAAPPDVRPTVGFAPLTVTFGGTEAADPMVTTLDLDVDGDGQPDFTLPNFAAPPHQVTYTYQTEGLYIATIVVRDQAGQSRTTRVLINVLPMPDLLPIWDAFRAVLARGDVDGGAGFVALEARERYRRVFSDLQADLPSIAAGMGAMTPTVITPEYATASCMRIRDGVSEAFLIHFLRDGDGVWRIASM